VTRAGLRLFLSAGFALAAASLSLGCRHTAPRAESRTERQPKSFYRDARPYTRWWWFASRMKREEIARQLDWLEEKGFGGVEIAWVYPLNIPRYKRFYPWISDEARARVDVPETEALLFEPPFARIVASAAALSAKRDVTSETFTCAYGFPRVHHKEEQTVDLKLIADAVFAIGVNQLFWHGTPFDSGDGAHDNEFYASVHVGRQGALTLCPAPGAGPDPSAALRAVVDGRPDASKRPHPLPRKDPGSDAGLRAVPVAAAQGRPPRRHRIHRHPLRPEGSEDLARAGGYGRAPGGLTSLLSPSAGTPAGTFPAKLR